MTQKELIQIYEINKEIRMWEEELESIREEILKSQKLSGMPFANTNETGDPTGQYAIKIAEIEKTITQKRLELLNARAAVIQFINTIDDSLTRMILKYRCLDCKKWENIAEILGYERTTVSKKYNDILRNLPKN